MFVIYIVFERRRKLYLKNRANVYSLVPLLLEEMAKEK